MAESVDPDAFAVGGDDGRPAETFPHGAREGGARVRLTVDRVHGVGLALGSAHPGQEVFPVAVHRETAHVDDLSPHLHVPPQHLHGRGAVEEETAPRARRLEADQENSVTGVGEAPGEVVDDPAPGGHTRGGDDHAGV